MSKRTKLLGAACGLAAATLVSGPASAATLMDFAGDLFTSYGMSNAENCPSCDFSYFTLGGNAAMPLSDIPNMNLQLGGAYTHGFRSGESAESWQFNAAVFWGGEDGRVGINGNYQTVTHSGNDSGLGLFGEMYFGNITVGGKFGLIQSGGSGGCNAAVAPVGTCVAGTTAGPLYPLPSGGSGGAYIGASATIYVMPNLALSGAFDHQNQRHGDAFAALTRIGVNQTSYGFEGEYMVDDAWATSVFANFSYNQLSYAGTLRDVTAWHIGLRWYTGQDGLMAAHRNGTLNPLLTGR